MIKRIAILFILTAGVNPLFAQDLDTVTLYLKWDHQFEFAGYYAAIENGYFEEEGLHVELEILKSGIGQIERVESQAGLYGISNSNLLSYRLDNHKVVLLLPVFQHSSVVFFTHKRDSILSPHDLIGKKLVIPKVMFPELYLMMKREGIEPTRTQIDSVWSLEKFTEGDAEAIVQLSLDRPYMPNPDKINIIHPLQYGLDFYGELLFTSELEMKRYPARSRKFRMATIRGWDYAMKHPDEMIDLILEKYNPGLARETLKEEYREVNELMSSGLVPIGQNNIGRWESIYREIDPSSFEDFKASTNGFFFEDYFVTDEERLNDIIAIIAILLGFLFLFLIVAWVINKRLNKLLDLRMHEINMRNNELLKMNSELDNFVYRVSHDLRAPISSSIGLLNLIEKEPSENELQEYHQLMRKSLIKLDNFILDILHYSRNSRLEVNREVIDFEKLIEEIIQSLGYTDRKVNIEVDVRNCGSVKEDKNRVSVILNNLISNSIRYSDPQKKDRYVNILVECRGSKITLVVEDNGVGIPGPSKEKVFEMFYRAHDELVGSGLGLYIVKEVVDKLEGTIELKSELGVGTKVTVVLDNSFN